MIMMMMMMMMMMIMMLATHTRSDIQHDGKDICSTTFHYYQFIAFMLFLFSDPTTDCNRSNTIYGGSFQKTKKWCERR